MYSLDSLLDDINTIDKDFGTKTAEVKTIKFTPHPPTTSKGKESSQQSVSTIGHLENPKYKFVATASSSSSTSSSRGLFSQGVSPSKLQGSPKEGKGRDDKVATSTTTKFGDKREPDLLDDLFHTLSNSPPVPTKAVVPLYKPTSSTNSNSIIFTPANNSSSNYDLNVFPNIGSNYFSSPSTTPPSAKDISSNYNQNALPDSKTQFQTINANFGSGKFKDSAAESGNNDRGFPTGGSVPSAAKARCSKVVLAGTAISRGLKSSAFSKCACDNLRCLQCNFTVHWFKDSTWDSSVDYLFLRNNMPNDGKLSSKILNSPGSCAYCCQCSWIHVSEEKQLITGQTASDPQWVCAGH